MAQWLDRYEKHPIRTQIATLDELISTEAHKFTVIGACESREAHSHKRPHELSPCLTLWGFNRVGFLKAGVSRHFEENDERLRTRFFQDRCGWDRYVGVLDRTRSPELMTVGITSP